MKRARAALTLRPIFPFPWEPLFSSCSSDQGASQLQIFFLQWLGSSNGSLTWFLTATDSKRPDSSISCRQARLELCTSTQTCWRMMQVGSFCCFIVLYVLKMHFFWKWFWGNGTFNAHCSCAYSPGGVQRFNLSPCGLIIVRPNATKKASGSHCTASSCRVCYVASACWNHLPPLSCLLCSLAAAPCTRASAAKRRAGSSLLVLLLAVSFIARPLWQAPAAKVEVTH